MNPEEILAKLPKGVYIHYSLWEESGMWRFVYGEERQELLNRAIVFTGDSNKYGEYMLRVVKEWPNSCAFNLSKQNANRQAWIGHAACYLALKCPEDITRLAWHKLTQEQQDRANIKADRAISEWENQYVKGIQSCLKLG